MLRSSLSLAVRVVPRKFLASSYNKIEKDWHISKTDFMNKSWRECIIKNKIIIISKS